MKDEKTPTAKQIFNFPEYSIQIEATSQEEAIKALKEMLSNAEKVKEPEPKKNPKKE